MSVFRLVVSELASRVLAPAPGTDEVTFGAQGHVASRGAVAVPTGRDPIEVRLARKEPSPR